MSAGTDAAGRVSLEQTLFASQLIAAIAGDAPLVRIVFDPAGLLVALADDVNVRVELLPADPSAVADLCRRAWRQHQATGAQLGGA